MSRNSGKSANGFMPLWGGDYLRDTMHLSAAEDGIYLRLLLHYWHTQRPLPADERKLCGIARVRTQEEREALESVLAEFFPLDGDCRRNRRMDHEIERWLEIQARATERGRKGGLASAQQRVKNKSTASSTDVQLESSPPPPPPPPPPSPQPSPQLAGGYPPQTPPFPAAREKTAAAGLRKRKGNGHDHATKAEAVWQAYRQAHLERYGVEPMRDAKVNAQIARFVTRVPADEAPEVARFFLTHQDREFVRRAHSVGLMLLHADRLLTEYRRRRAITSTEAAQADRTAATANSFAGLLKEAH